MAKKKSPTPEEVAAAVKKETMNVRPTGMASRPDSKLYSKKQARKDITANNSEYAIGNDRSLKPLVTSNFWGRFPDSNERLMQEKLDECMQLIENDTSILTIDEMYIKARLTRGVVYGPFRKYTAWLEFMDYAKMVVGARRERGAILKEYDSGMIKATMPNYDPEYRKLEEWRAQIKSTEDAKKSVSLVVVNDPLPLLVEEDDESTSD